MVDNTALDRFSSKYSAFPSKNNSNLVPFSLFRGECDKDVLSLCFLRVFNQSSMIKRHSTEIHSGVTV